jgi:hypothetical protein
VRLDVPIIGVVSLPLIVLLKTVAFPPLSMSPLWSLQELPLDLARRKKANRRQAGGEDHVIYDSGQC